jgi:hypothetical protein
MLPARTRDFIEQPVTDVNKMRRANNERDSDRPQNFFLIEDSKTGERVKWAIDEPPRSSVQKH